MAKKQNYKLAMRTGEEKEVKGEVYGNFGVHKRDDGLFVLTHLPSGCHVVSAEKKKELIKLLKDEAEEFETTCWESPRPDTSNVNRLSRIISRYYSGYYDEEKKVVKKSKKSAKKC